MAQYIDKSALVAEIERRNVICKKVALDLRTQGNKDYYQGKAEAYKEVLDILDTLEVKEVDLEKEIQDHIKECLDVKFPTTDIELIKKDVTYTARKFFELGLKAQKGE